jgi:AcrR family transcriptional regulator
MTEKSKPLDRRNRRISKRRQSILEVSAEVFSEKGYNRASIKDIAEAADVADGTIYNYFENKEALLLTLFDQLIDVQHLDSQLASTLEDDVDQVVATYVEAHLAKVRSHYDLFRAVIPEILATPDLRQRYYETFVAPMLSATERHIRTRSAQGQLPDGGEKQLARVMYALFFGLLCLRIMGDPEIQPSEQVDAALLGTISQLLAK